MSEQDAVKEELAAEAVGLHSLKPAPGSKKDRKRVGRGHGSGHGKTSGRGHKGYNSRAGAKDRARFEGGQNPLHMRMRKLRGPNKKMSMPFEPFRTHTQHVNLDDLEALSDELDKRGRRLMAALLIHAPDEVVINRLSGRRQCSEGHLYHVEFDPPKHEGKCDQCGKPLRQREDDQPDKVSKRLATYHEKTEPLIDYYEERGLLRRFDGTRDKVEVHDHIRATLATLRLEERL